VRVLHVTDLHLLPHLPSVPWSDWLGKRFTGAFNYFWNRKGQFASAPEKLAALAVFAREHGVDAVLCTGDFTLWATELELRSSRRAIQPLVDSVAAFVTLPGNHDVYTHGALAERRFARHFGDLMESDLPDASVDGRWPIVRLLGSEVAAVVVNSAIPHSVPWRSTGRIPAAQLGALRRLLADERLSGRFVFVMTHHAPLLADGGADSEHHRLENASEFLDACRGLKTGAVLCGHVHRCYETPIDGTNARLFNGGSATLTGAESFWLFDVGAERITARRGEWHEGRYRLAENG